jgi:hypothetical protein
MCRRHRSIGEIAGGEMQLTGRGWIAGACRRLIPAVCRGAAIDEFVATPDQFHAGIAIDPCGNGFEGAAPRAARGAAPIRPHLNSARLPSRT